MHQYLKSLCCWTASLLAIFSVLLSSPSAAVDDDAGTSFLTPFPENDTYQVTVFGDGFADGLLPALVEAFTADVRLNIQHQLTSISGLAIPDFDAKATALEQTIGSQTFNIAIVMVGEDDRFSMRNGDGKRMAVASEEWLAEYSRRVDRLMKAFKRRNAALYWVGLPTLGRIDASEQAKRMNDVLRERAYLNGGKYIDAYQGFTDENGQYSAYGPDLEGAIRQLRLRDGVTFTDVGNRKLAHFVEKELRADLNQAKSNRNVPLLGSEAEQAKINPDNAVKTPAPSSPVAAKAPSDPKAPVVRVPALSGTPPSATSDESGDQKADNGKVLLKVVGANGRAETQTIEIVRPAIPASVVALMARREGSSQRGDLLVDQVAGGLTLMNSITPSGNKARGKLSPTQAPYFRLLVKGERLQPKPGRADDVTWPPKASTTSEARPQEPSPRG